MNSSANTAPIRKRLASTLAYAGLLYAFICTFPLAFQAVAPGLDASWMFALNKLAGSGAYLFGRDVAFTYGPLGFLLVPRDVGTGISFVTSEALWCLLQLALFGALAWRFSGSATTLLLLCAGYSILVALGVGIEYRFVFAACAFGLLSLGQDRANWLFAVGAALLGSIGLLMKLGSGLSVLSVVAGTWLVLLTNGGRASRTVVGRGMIAAVVSFVALSWFLFRSPVNFWKWTRELLEVVSGYSAAMSIAGEKWPLVLAAASVGCLICMHFLLTAPLRRCLWLFLAVVFFAFKEAFVRQDGHRLVFFTTAGMIPILLLLAPSVTGRDKRRLMGSFLFLAGIIILFASNYQAFPALRWREVASLLSMGPGLENIQRLIFFSRTREELRAEAIQNLVPDVLPDSWQRRFEDPRASVSIIPSELSIAAANRMNWKPMPVLQLYSAYTAELDAITAAGLADSGAEYLVVTYEAIDGRNLLMDTPSAWRSVMEHYEIADVDPNERRILLARTPPNPEATREVLNGRASMNEWVPVRETTHLLYASLYLNYTMLGKLADTLYQIPPLYIEMCRRSGRLERYRLISRTAVNGFVINYPPANQYDLEDLLRGTGTDSVIRFRIVPPPSSWLFRNEYTWALLESTRVVTPAGGAPRPPTDPEISPSAGEGRRAVIEIASSDPNGVRDLNLIQVLVNHDLSGVKACYLSYDATANRLWLIADAGSGSAGYGQAGDGVALTNSQCTIPLQQTSVRIEGNVLRLRVAIEFKDSLKGTENFYVSAMDRSGLRTAWKARAVWQVK